MRLLRRLFNACRGDLIEITEHDERWGILLFSNDDGHMHPMANTSVWGYPPLPVEAGFYDHTNLRDFRLIYQAPVEDDEEFIDQEIIPKDQEPEDQEPEDQEPEDTEPEDTEDDDDENEIEKFDINNVLVTELIALPGIGRAGARTIMASIPYRNLDQLQKAYPYEWEELNVVFNRPTGD